MAKKHGVKLDISAWSRENLAWLSGIVEGEGHWRGATNSRNMQMRITMADLGLVKTVQRHP